MGSIASNLSPGARVVRLIVLGALLVPVGLCHAATWHVPADVPYIFAAVDSASYGDTVLVAPGTYLREREKDDGHSNTLWIEMKDGVTLISEGGASSVTLVETSEAPFTYVIMCDSADGASVTGFTIVDGMTLLTGGDVETTETIYDVGIGLHQSDVLIMGNVVSGFYWGIEVSGETGAWYTPLLKGNEISGCLYGIGIGRCQTGYAPKVEDNVIHGCYIGIWANQASPYICGNRVSDCWGTGAYFFGYSGALMVSNKIIRNGEYGVYAWMTDWFYSPDLNCTAGLQFANDVYGNGLYDVYYREDTGGGLFCANLNYWGTNCPDGSRFYGRVQWDTWTDSTHTDICSSCDTCGTATLPTSWGAIKALFR